MTRRQWIGLAGLLFGLAMIAGIVISGTTPDSSDADAVEKYTAYWSDSGHQDSAQLGSFILTYACVLLVCFAGGLRYLLRGDDSPLPGVVLGAGVGAAALLGAGGALVNGAGIAAVESSGYRADGSQALLVESIGYYTLTVGIMLAAVMAVSTTLANRRLGVLPGWTVVFSALLALATVASIYTAWVGFMLLPLWSVVVGICLLATRGAQDPVVDA
jgi:hypothetical protein